MNITDLMPADTPAHMAPAWLGCIGWAIKQPEIVESFRAETGNNWRPAKPGIDRMVDEATGAPHAFMVEFIKWANVNVWGSMGGEVPE